MDFEEGEILEVRGVYYIKNSFKEKKKGASSEKRKCETTWHYQVSAWPKGELMSVAALRDLFAEPLIYEGLATIQDRSVIWDCVIIKSLTRRTAANNIIRAPIEGVTGRATGTCRNNRALAIEVQEKFKGSTRKSYIRGVSEEYANIPSTGKPLQEDPLWIHALTIQKAYLSPIETQKVVFTPGKLDKKNSRAGSPVLVDMVSVKVLGIEDLPERTKRTSTPVKKYKF